jgi:hypothetical protein
VGLDYPSFFARNACAAVVFPTIPVSSGGWPGFALADLTVPEGQPRFVLTIEAASVVYVADLSAKAVRKAIGKRSSLSHSSMTCKTWRISV